MRILIVSYYFSQEFAVASTRLQAFANGLRNRGHDIDVLTTTTSLKEFETDDQAHLAKLNVHQVKEVDIKPHFPTTISNRKGKSSEDPSSSKTGRRLKRTAKNLFAIPDSQLGWGLNAIRRGRRVCIDASPNVILSSYGPATSILVGTSLSKSFAIPHVVDYRDLWSGHPDSDQYPWRESLDKKLEQKLLKSSSSITTVNHSMANYLSNIHGKPSRVIPNGIDFEAIKSSLEEATAPPSTNSSKSLTVRYMGSYYPNRYDISPLFEAIRSNKQIRNSVRFEFFGSQLGPLKELTSGFGSNSQLQVFPPVSRNEAIQLQSNADILLLFIPKGDEDLSTVPAKLFEYAGVGRPILAIGRPDSASSEIIQKFNLGTVTDDTREIEHTLLTRLDEKGRLGHVPSPVQRDMQELDREKQIDRMEEVLKLASQMAATKGSKIR